jgi:hypothetical protein
VLSGAEEADVEYGDAAVLVFVAAILILVLVVDASARAVADIFPA